MQGIARAERDGTFMSLDLLPGMKRIEVLSEGPGSNNIGQCVSGHCKAV